MCVNFTIECIFYLTVGVRHSDDARFAKTQFRVAIEVLV